MSKSKEEILKTISSVIKAVESEYAAEKRQKRGEVHESIKRKYKSAVNFLTFASEAMQELDTLDKKLNATVILYNPDSGEVKKLTTDKVLALSLDNEELYNAIID